MLAIDLNKSLECPICGGTGDDPIDRSADCRRCEGVAEINRYGPDDSSIHSDNVVILTEHISDNTNVLHMKRIPISDKNMGGFNERFGDETVNDVSTEPIANYQQDMKDRLQNRLGQNTNRQGKYQMPDKDPYNGDSYSSTDMPNQMWPRDPNLTVDEIIAWMSNRGDDYTANIFRNLKSELGL